jgi:hypothetical protein
MDNNQFDKYEAKKQHRRLLVVSLLKQHHLFVREGLDDAEENLSEQPSDFDHDTSYDNWNWQVRADVTDQFKFGCYLYFQVKPTEQVMIVKNGVPETELRPPGRHIVINRDPFFTRYQIYRFNTQIVTLKALVDGRVHDPNMHLDLRVIAEFRILCRLRHFERFLFEVDKPLRLLYTIFNSVVFEELANLKHDLLGKWAIELKDRVFRRLSGEGSEVEKQIGVEIVNIYVDNLSNNPMYVEYHDKIFGFKVDLSRDVARAQAQREEADILGIDPSHIRFEGTDMGSVSIQGEMDRKNMQASFGLLFPQLPPPGNQSSNSAGIGSGLPLFGPSSYPSLRLPESTPPGANPSSYPSLRLPEPTPPGANPPSGNNTTQKLEGENNLVTEERQEQEITALRQAGFVPQGKGRFSAEGWDISVTTRLPNNDLLTISFRCDSNYPYRPPTVYYGRRVLEQLESLLNWDFYMLLVDIAKEARSMLSAEFAADSE